MENITVNALCNMTIDHHEQTTNVIDNLDIKTFGSVDVFTEDEALTTLTGTTLTVRSGAKVCQICSIFGLFYELHEKK
jgi:hypothetical protein